MPPRLIQADGLILGDGVALRDGAVVVAEDGTVLDVAAAVTLRPRHQGATVERIRGVVFPGLVNAHTHVELSSMRGRVPGGRGFVGWVSALVQAKEEVTPEAEREAIDQAADQLDRFATAAVGDVSNRLVAVRALARRGVGGVVFHEVFGVEEAALRRAVAGLADARERVVGNWPTSDVGYVVAPHTLYTTHPAVVRDLVRHARQSGAVTSLHLAEHPAERRALEHAEGPVVEWLARVTAGASVAFPWPRLGPVAHADALEALGPHVLSVHVADVRESELAILAARQASVVLCPRSNLFIERRLPQIFALCAAGVRLALGTDSLASNDSLDVLAEARALRDFFPGVPARELVQMATWNGAQALGRPDLGRIAKGTKPGLAAVAGVVGESDPSAFLLSHVDAPRSWVARRKVDMDEAHIL